MVHNSEETCSVPMISRNLNAAFKPVCSQFSERTRTATTRGFRVFHKQLCVFARTVLCSVKHSLVYLRHGDCQRPGAPSDIGSLCWCEFDVADVELAAGPAHVQSAADVELGNGARSY